MKKRLSIMLSIVIIGLSGCEKETSSQIVIEKEAAGQSTSKQTTVESKQSEGKKTTTQAADTQGADKKNLAQMVEAPEVYQVNVSGEKLTVTGNAKVVVPEVEAIRVKTITPRAFSEAERKKFRELGFQGQAAENEQHWETNPFIQSEKSTNGESRLPVAIALPEMVSSLPYSDVGDISEATIGGEPYVFLDWKVDEKGAEGLQPQESMLTVMQRYANIGGGNFASRLLSYKKQVEPLSKAVDVEALIQKGNKMVTSLGYKDMPFWGYEYVQLLSEDEITDTDARETKPLQMENGGVALYYMRSVDGILINFDAHSMKFPRDFGCFWQPELLHLVYSAKGELVEMEYRSPYEVHDSSKEDAFLLPFSEITKIFESVVTQNYRSEMAEMQRGAYTITEVRLGYGAVGESMPNQKRGEPSQLIPVWEFYGEMKETYQFEEEKQPSERVMDEPYYPLLTINAMDGSIVEKMPLTQTTENNAEDTSHTTIEIFGDNDVAVDYDAAVSTGETLTTKEAAD